MSVMGPGCVKTWTSRPVAQQSNLEGNGDESLLRRRPASRINITSRRPKNSFYTAWVKSCRNHASRFTTASPLSADIAARHLQALSSGFATSRGPSARSLHRSRCFHKLSAPTLRQGGRKGCWGAIWLLLCSWARIWVPETKTASHQFVINR